jgi:hypothetical protein
MWPQAKWNWDFIAANPNTTWSLILEYEKMDKWRGQDYIFSSNDDSDWNWDYISVNPNITLDIIAAHPEKWNWKTLSMNPNMTLEFVKANLDKKFNWRYLTHHKNITYQNINDNPELPWNLDDLPYNPNVEIKDLLYNDICRSSKVTPEFVRDNPQINWDFNAELSRNDNFTWDFIVANLHKDWNWYELSKRIHQDIIFANLDNYDWLLHGILINPSVTFDKLPIKINNIIAEQFIIYSDNPNLTWEIIIENPTINWSLFRLCINNFNYKKTFY